MEKDKILILYCLDCGEEQHTYMTIERGRYCIICLGNSFASCPPPEMTKEQWQHIFETEGGSYANKAI